MFYLKRKLKKQRHTFKGEFVTEDPSSSAKMGQTLMLKVWGGKGRTTAVAGKKTVCCVYSIEDLKEMALADAKSQLGVDGKYEVEADDYGDGDTVRCSSENLSGIRITVRRVQ